MDVDIGEIDEKKRFDVKLQISLYNTALKVFREDKEDEFNKYMNERVENIKEILDIKDEKFRIFENGEKIFEVP